MDLDATIGVTVEIVRTEKKTLRLTYDDLFKMINAVSNLDIDSRDLKTRMYVEVPGGGDYSNTRLDVDNAKDGVHLVLEWEEQESSFERIVKSGLNRC